MKFNFSLFLAVFSIATLSFSQNFNAGFIVTQQYDTLEGLVKRQGDRASEKICVFKKSDNSKENFYNPDEILSYGYKGGRVYISNQLGIEINRLEPSFIRLIVDGDVPLYYFGGQYAYRAPSKRLYLLLKEDNFYRANISAVLVNDCYDLTNQIKNLQLTDKSLANFFLSYHSCLNKPAKAYMSGKVKSNIDFAIGSGISSFASRSTESSFEEFDYSRPTTSSLNLQIRYIKGSRNKLNLTTAFSFIYNKGFLIDYTDESAAYETGFDYSSMRLSIGAKYFLANITDNLRLTVHLDAGVGLSSVKNQKRIIDEIQGNEILITNETFEIDKLEPFASVGLIADYSLNNRNFFIEINDSMAFGKIEGYESNNADFSLNNIAIMIGIKLPLGK